MSRRETLFSVGEWTTEGGERHGKPSSRRFCVADTKGPHVTTLLFSGLPAVALDYRGARSSSPRSPTRICNLSPNSSWLGPPTGHHFLRANAVSA